MGGIEVRVQLFAKAKELAGGRDFLLCSLAEADAASISCQDFLDRYVYTAEPNLEALKGSAFLAVNDEYVEPLDILTLKASDDIALIPPISGG